jgi:hypothetical protein
MFGWNSSSNFGLRIRYDIDFLFLKKIPFQEETLMERGKEAEAVFSEVKKRPIG